MIVLGNKVNDAAEQFFITSKKRPLIAELLRIVETENAKRKRKTKAIHKKEQQEKRTIKKEVADKVVVVREEKKKKKAIVNYGIFTTLVNVVALELLERKRK